MYAAANYELLVYILFEIVAGIDWPTYVSYLGCSY